MSDSAPDPSWAPGYETSELLRQGRRAHIVRATRTTSGTDVVLKVLTAEAGRTELDWLRTLSGVFGVTPLLDAGTTTAGDMFVVLPYYRDGSFADMLSRVGPAPLQEAATVARSISVALGAIHAQGLTHNDVSPGNVLRAGRTPVLTSFGSVHPVGRPLPPPAASTEIFLHSPPEALRGEPRTPASDVYQLASTVWTMLVGHAPFSATDGSPFNPQAYVERVFNEPPPPVSRQDISRKLRGVLNRALSKHPEERYETTAVFSTAFEQARTSRPATTVSRATGASTPLPGAQVPLSGHPSSLHPHSGPQTPLSGPQAPLSGPQTPPTASKHPYLLPHTQQDDSWLPAEPRETSAPPTALESDPHPSSESPDRFHPPERELPSPEERRKHGATPENSPNSTADIAMARLRGEKISPLVAWSRLEGWTGDAEDSYLPVDESPQDGDTEPEWDILDQDRQQPRWREHLHIAVTVCGILLVTVAASAFAATRPPEPMTVAAETEKEDETGEEAATAEEEAPEAEAPSPPPEVSAPTEVGLEDSFSSVTLTWTDNSGGTTSYFVLGERQGHEPLTMARTGPGTVTAQVSTENELAEYCFTVIAVDGAAAPAEEVCTTRASDLAQLEEPEEEDEEEEDEDKEEDDADPSPTPSPDADD